MDYGQRKMDATEEGMAVDWLPRRWPDDPLKWVVDRWIQVLGIVFLLLGVGFLFKYSYENGLLIPPLRVLCGMGIGGSLAFAGWRIKEARRNLAHVLLGGASATLYITLFAAAQLYELIPGPVAFAGMMAVTMATFLASVTERGALLANIATIGGFVTPFLLDIPLFSDPHVNDIATLVYMCIVLLGSTAIFAYHGWRSILITSATFMWGYLTLVAFSASTPLEQIGAQAAVVLTWLATGVVPTARHHFIEKSRPTGTGHTLAHLFALGVPALAMLLSRAIWTVDDPIWGFVSLIVAGGYAASSFYLRSSAPRGLLATTHALIAIGFTTLALTDLLSGSTLMIGLLIEAVALCWIGSVTAPDHRNAPPAGSIERWCLPDRLMSIIGHTLLAIGCIHSVSLFVTPVSMPFVGAQGLQLLLTALALAIVGRTHEPEAVRPGFWWAAHLFFLGTVLHQSSALAHGDLVSTACWGVYSLLLITTGLTRQSESLQWMGLVALLLAAGKLLFIDMSGAETLWRVLLFLGFGLALLVLNYLAPQWGSGATGKTDEVAEAS